MNDTSKVRTVKRPSPNHDDRRPGAAIDMLVLHYTGMRSADAAVDRLCDPAARVSAHYCIDEEGRVFELVAEARRAWHAGVGYWAGERDINNRSIGIELVNPGHEFGYRPFPESQMLALERLALGILARHPIPARRVLGHSDVAPARKIDPGELFDWQRLARSGIGLWPNTAGFPAVESAATSNAIATVQSQLAAFGYEIAVTGMLDQATALGLSAFQRHFRPGLVNG
ncbi:MAG: N-acetylmuramoyl-L-alanine amidase, partial [Pseudomonadota bacterium]